MSKVNVESFDRARVQNIFGPSAIRHSDPVLSFTLDDTIDLVVNALANNLVALTHTILQPSYRADTKVLFDTRDVDGYCVAVLGATKRVEEVSSVYLQYDIPLAVNTSLVAILQICFRPIADNLPGDRCELLHRDILVARKAFQNRKSRDRSITAENNSYLELREKAIELYKQCFIGSTSREVPSFHTPDRRYFDPLSLSTIELVRSTLDRTIDIFFLLLRESKWEKID